MINTGIITKLNTLLDNSGLRKAWADILQTKIIFSEPKFQYILADDFFSDSKPLNFNLLSGLSIGEISVLYEYSLARVNQSQREDEGQYFTPDDVAVMMSKRASHFEPGVWIDPCSGIGNLSYWLIKEQKEREHFFLNSIYLVDIDFVALFICRVLFTLEFQNEHVNLFNESEHRFICTNYLQSENLPAYDYAILNPPYVVTKPNIKFKSALTKNTYAYFLEKVMGNSKGFISVTPQTFTHSPAYKPIRSLLINKFNDLSIYCFDNVPQNIFKGYKFGSNNTNKANSTRAAIIIAISTDKKETRKITPLLRWKSTEREELFNLIDSFLSEVPFSSSTFPKVGNTLVPLYIETMGYPRVLKDLLSRNKTMFYLQVPSTPRYFISALKSIVSRTSSRILFFHNEQELDIAYLLLNSSYMYWWWRINDGGMTISEKTLFSLPIPHYVDVDLRLVKELENSESVNKVYKKNANKIIENVKHDYELINRITRSLFPSYDKELLYTHNNSIIVREEFNKWEQKAFKMTFER